VEGDAGSTEGHWDEPRLGQILANLVGNALRHGDKHAPVRIRVLGEPPGVVIEVHNGGTIAESVRDHLFDPFRRGAHSSRDTLGLGLYIVQQIVLAHGGGIDVRSTEHDGTVFRVQLPRHAPARSEGGVCDIRDPMALPSAGSDA
jgi:phosphoserine phosphatase RsbU/P